MDYKKDPATGLMLPRDLQEMFEHAPKQTPIGPEHIPDWVAEKNYSQILMSGLSGRNLVYQKATRSRQEAKAIKKRRDKKKGKR